VDGGPELVEIARRLAGEGAAAKGAWEAFEARALQSCGALRSGEIVQLLHACTVAKRRPRQLLLRLAQEIPDRLPQFSTGGLCVCLHSYAQVRVRDGKLFAAVVRRLLAEERRRALEPPHLASLLYSHARCLLNDRGLLAAAGARLAKGADTVAMEDLATMLQAFATFRSSDTAAVAACASAAAWRVDHHPLPALCDVLRALATVGVPCGALQRGLVRRVEERPAVLKGLAATELLHLVHGLAGVEGAEATCDAAMAQLEGCLDQLDGHWALGLVQAMEALARCRAAAVGRPRLIEALCERLVARLVDLSAKQVASAAGACQRLRVRDGALLEGLARQGQRKGSWFLPKHAEAVLKACDAAGFEHSVVDELRESLQLQGTEGAATGPVEKYGDEFDGEAGDREVSSGPFGDGVLFEEERPAAAATRRGKAPSDRPPRDAGGASPGGRSSPAAQDNSDDELPPEIARLLPKEKNDVNMMKLYHGVDRKVLRPAGLRSAALSQGGRRRRAVFRAR